MEIVGTRFKSNHEDHENGKVDENHTRQNGTRSCRQCQERAFALLPQKQLPLLPTPTATAPKKGMIRLTALPGELENPRLFFNCASASSSASTASQGRKRRSPVSRSVEPRTRVCGVSYKPESLQNFGRQMTMFELHKTVDSLIEDSAKKNEGGRNVPKLQELDQEVSRRVEASQNQILLRSHLTPDGTNSSNG